MDELVDEDVEILDVELEYPVDGVYEPGRDAFHSLAMSNTGEQPDTLADVSGPAFDASVDGTPADGLAIEVAGSDTVFVGAGDEPTLTLVDLDRELRSSQSVEVTVRFVSAGEVTVQAAVAAEGRTPSPSVDFSDPAEDPTGS